MNISKLRLVKISTTSFLEEDFFLVTNLTTEQIIKELSPIVERERDGKGYYYNDMLCKHLEETFPNNIVLSYPIDGYETIDI